MEYEHGIRVTALPHELTPLENAIDGFRHKAQSYYDEKARHAHTKYESDEVRQAREKELATAFAHLEIERRFAEVKAEIQVRLEEYRNKGRSTPKETFGEAAKREKLLAKEKHHPTDVLARYMRAVGRPQPSSKHTAHHIVPGKGKTVQATRARIRLHFFGVRINDPDNGVWMIRYKRDKGHWSMPTTNSHLEIHTHNYEGWINRSLQLASSEWGLRMKLNDIRLLLKTGNQPKQVTMPPDDAWDGTV